MPRNRIVLITVGVMLSLFLASMEATVVATAMPTIVAELGGLASYSWVFSIYMLTSTTTGPIYGKLSDIYGRRTIYLAAIGLFVVGSILCGFAQTMGQLIAARAVQGIGAGGLLPLAFIIVGDIFSFEQRAKMQGLFSGVWGVSSIVGPLIGGFMVDIWSWHWIFFANAIPAVIAAVLVWAGWAGEKLPTQRPAIDYAGAALLSVGVVALLMGMLELGSALSWGALLLAALCLVLLLRVEARAAAPIIPLDLFRGRLFLIACLHGFLAAWGLFGLMSYIPLFVQGVQGTSATEAGTTLTPMLLGWVGASIVGSRLLLQISSRALTIAGMACYLAGALMLLFVTADTSRLLLMSGLATMGVGMGLSIPSLLIAVQSSVPKAILGAATATVQFTRNLGGTIGVSIMGALLSNRIFARLSAAGVDPASAPIDSLLSAGEGGAVDAVGGPLRLALAGAIHDVFVMAAVVAAIVFVVVFFTPGGSFRSTTNPAPAAAD